MQFNLENITSLAQTIFKTSTPFSEKVKKSLTAFLEQDKETDVVYLGFDDQRQAWIVSRKLENGGKLIQFEKYASISAKSPSFVFRIINGAINTDNGRLVYADRSLVKALAMNVPITNDIVQLALKDELNWIDSADTLLSLISMLKDEKVLAKLKGNDKALAEKMLTLESSLARIMSQKMPVEKMHRLLEIASSVLDKDYKPDTPSKLLHAFVDLTYWNLDDLINSQLDKIQRTTFNNLPFNVKVFSESKKLVEAFWQKFRAILQLPEFAEIRSTMQNLNEFLEQNEILEEIVQFLKVTGSSSDIFSSNLFTLYSSMDVFEVLEFENRLNLFFDVEANFKVMDKKFEKQTISQGDLITEGQRYRALCYFFSITDHFQQHRLNLVEDIKDQINLLKTTVAQMLERAGPQSLQTVEMIKESRELIKRSIVLENLQSKMMIEDNSMPIVISNLRKFVQKTLQGWNLRFRKSVHAVKPVIQSEKNLDLATKKGSEDLATLRTFIEFQKEHALMKELMANPLFGDIDATDLTFEDETINLFWKSKQFFQNLSRWQNLIGFYQSLEQKYSKSQLKFVHGFISELEADLKAIKMENFDKILSRGEQLMAEIEANLARVSQFEAKTHSILFKAIHTRNGSYDYVKQIQSCIQELEGQFEAKTIQSIVLNVKHQLLKVVFMDFKILLKSKKIYPANGQPVKIQLRKQPGDSGVQIYPGFLALKKMLYARIQDHFKIIESASEGLKRDYVQNLIDFNLKEDIGSAYKFIETLIDELKQYLHSLLNLESTSTASSNSPLSSTSLNELSFENLHEFCSSIISKISYLQARVIEVENLPQTLDFQSLIRIQTTMAKGTMIEEIQSNFTDFTATLKALSNECLSRSSNFIFRFEETMSKRIETIEQFKVVNDFILNVKVEKDKVQKMYYFLREALNVLRKFEGESSLAKKIGSFMKNWERIQSMQMSSNIEIEKLRSELRKLLETQTATLKTEVAMFEESKPELILTIKCIALSEINFEEIKRKADFLQNKTLAWNSINSQINDLKKNFESLGQQASQLDHLAEKISGFEELFAGEEYEAASRMLGFWQKIIGFCGESWPEFHRLNWKKLIEFIDETISNSSLFSSKSAYNQHYHKVASQYQTYFKTYLSLMTGEFYTNTDWLELLSILDLKKLSIEAFTFECLLTHDIKIKSSIMQIREINTRIHEEANIRKMIEEVMAWKANTELKFSHYSFVDHTSIPLIAEWESLLDQISDFGFQVRIMSDSKFKQKFRDQLESMNEFFDSIEFLYQNLQNIQQRMIYLDPILSKAKLEDNTITEQFNKTKARLGDLFKCLKETKLLSSILSFSNVNHLLNDSLKLFEHIQRVLQQFLETKRLAFTRLYLLSDEDLIELIGNSDSETALQLYLPKIFAAVGRVTLTNDLSIMEIHSQPTGKSNEMIIPTHKVNVKELETEVWLSEMQHIMSSHLRKHLKEYSYEYIDSMEFYRNLEFNLHRPLQVLFVAQEVSFESLFNNCLRSRNFKTLIEGYMNFIKELNRHNDSKETKPVDVEKMKQVIMFTVRKISILRECSEKPESLNWLSFKTMLYQAYSPNQHAQPEPDQNKRAEDRAPVNAKIKGNQLIKNPQIETFMNGSKNQLSSNIGNTGRNASKSLIDISVEMAGSKMHYSWEYQGLKSPLVYTTLTDKIFVSLSRCINDRQGANLTGPAGTGKTESVKFFAQHLGRNVVVFNCDETLTFDIIGRIFKGFLADESFGCFDEFNRLNPNQMSVVSQLIQSLQFTLRRMQCEKTKMYMEDFKSFPAVNPNCAVFITMNPKNTEYGARYALPQNLKTLFRVINVSTPSENQVFEVLLMAEGCAISRELATNLGEFFQLARKELSKQTYYDWSLRKVKSVISSFKSFKSYQKNGHSNEDGNVNDDRECILKAIETNILSYLLPADLVKFDQVATKVFGEVYKSYKNSMTQQSSAQNNIQEAHTDIKFAFQGSLASHMKEKLNYLENLLKARDGVILHGSSMTGKSILWKCLLMQEYAKHSSVEYYVLNPKIGTKKLMLGKMNKDSGDFIDGYLTRLFRKFQKKKDKHLALNSDQLAFLIFDSEIDSEWIEALNSVLDDNKMLSLPNGERIAIPSYVKFIFETRSLKYASPATLSRLGIISMETDARVNFSVHLERKTQLLGINTICLRFEDSIFASDSLSKNDANSNKMSMTTMRTKANLDEKMSSKSSVKKKSFGQDPNQDLKTFEAFSFFAEFLKLKTRDEDKTKDEYGKSIIYHNDKLKDNVDRLDTRPAIETSKINNQGLKLSTGLSSHNSIDSFSVRDSNNTKMFANMDVFISLIVPSQYCSSFSKLLQSNIQFIIENLPIASKGFNSEIVMTASNTLFRGYSQEKMVEIVSNADEFSTPNTKAQDVIGSDLNIEELIKTLVSKKVPLVLFGPYIHSPSQSALQNVGLNLTEAQACLTIPCTAALKTRDIIRILKSNFQIINRNGKKWFDKKSSEKFSELIVFTNFEAIDQDSYECREIHEAIYMILNHKIIVDCETRDIIHFSDFISFIFLCQTDYAGLIPSVTMKLLRLCFIVHINDSPDSDGNPMIESFNKKQLSTNEGLFGDDKTIEYLRSVLKDFKERAVNKFGTAISYFTEKIDADFESQLCLSAETFSIVSKASAKYVIFWYLKLYFIGQITDYQIALTCEQILTDLLEIQDPSICSLLKMNDKSNDVSDRFEFVSQSDLEPVFANLKSIYNENYRLIDLKFIPSQIDLFQIVSVSIAINQHRQQISAFILNSSRGKGRKTILNLVAISEGFEAQFFQSQPTGNALKDFRKLFISALNDIFMSKKRIMLVVEEHQISDLKLFDELILFIKCGILKGFEREDRENLVRLNPEFIKSGDSSVNLLNHFMNNVASNLIITIVIDNGTITADSLMAKYPAMQNTFQFINCDYVFRNRPAGYFLEAQLQRILSVDELTSIMTRLDQSGMINFLEDATPVNSFPSLVNFYENIVELFNFKTQELANQSTFYELGVAKISEAQQQVLALQQLAQEKSKVIQTKTLETESALKQISDIYSKTKTKFESLKKAEDQLKEREFEIICKKEEVLNQLSQVTPALEAARSQIKSISKSHMDELRSLKVPSIHIVNVFTALMKLKDRPKASFDEAKKIFSSAAEIEELANLDFKKIEERTLRSVKEFMQSESLSFDTKTIFHVSKAAGPIAEFIKAIVRCREFYSTIEPFEKSLESLERSLEMAKKDTEILRSDVEKIENEIWELKNSYATKLGETEIYKKQLENINKRLQMAGQLLNALPDEKTRWAAKIQEIAKTKDKLLGFCFAASWRINFSNAKSSFKHRPTAKSASDRTHLHINHTSSNRSNPRNNNSNEMTKMDDYDRAFDFICEAFGIEKFDLISFLSDEKTLIEMSNHGIPQNQKAIENIFRSAWSSGYPLIVDPSEKIIEFIKQRGDKSFISVSLHDKSLFQKLLTSLKSGHTIIVENFSQKFPTFLYSIIRKDFFSRNLNSREITICGKNISVSSYFKAIFTTKFIENVNQPNSLSSDYLNFIDNSYGLETLVSHYISIVLENFDVGLLKERRVCLEKQSNLKEKLIKAETTLLESISKIQGNLLDDDNLIRQLEQLKQESVKINEQITDSQKVMEMIKSKEARYLPLATFISKTFINISKIQALNSFYNFSIGYYDFNVQTCLSNPDVAFLFTTQQQIDRFDLSTFVESFVKIIAKNYGVALIPEDMSLFLLLLLKSDEKVHIDDISWQLIVRDLHKTAESSNAAEQQMPIKKIVSKARSSSKRISISLFKDYNNLINDPEQEDDNSEGINNETKLINKLSEIKEEIVDLLAENVPDLMNELRRNYDVWLKWLESKASELEFPLRSHGSPLSIGHKLLLIYMLRKDRLMPFLYKVFQDCFRLKESEFVFNAYDCASNWRALKGPLIFQIKEDADPMSDIRLMIKNSFENPMVEELSCGEGNSKMILDRLSSAQDKILIFKNFHLCSKIYDEAFSVIKALESSNQSRLIFVTEDASTLPLELVDSSLKINYQKDQDFQQNMAKHYVLLGENRFSELSPAVSNYLFCLVYLHVSLCELEKSSTFFSKQYEINWNDFERAVNFLAQSRFDDDETLKSIFTHMLKYSFYGAKIDIENDLIAFEQLVNRCFSFEKNKKNLAFELPQKLSFEEHKEKAKRCKLPALGDHPNGSVQKSNADSMANGTLIVKMKKLFRD